MEDELLFMVSEHGCVYARVCAFIGPFQTDTSILIKIIWATLHLQTER